MVVVADLNSIIFNSGPAILANVRVRSASESCSFLNGGSRWFTPWFVVPIIQSPTRMWLVNHLHLCLQVNWCNFLCTVAILHQGGSCTVSRYVPLPGQPGTKPDCGTPLAYGMVFSFLVSPQCQRSVIARRKRQRPGTATIDTKAEPRAKTNHP